MITAAISANTPCTAMPTIRNGRRISQTNGYAITANRATGQQITNRRHQARNVNIEHLRRVSSLRYARIPSEVPRSHLAVGQVFLQKGQSTAARIVPDLALEVMANAGIDLHLVRNTCFLEHLLQVVSFLDGHGRVSVAVQDQRGAQTSHEKLHFFGKSAEK